MGEERQEMTEPLSIRCPNCGAINRVPQEKLQQGLEPICGRCKTPLPVHNKPVLVTDANFPVEVERSPLPILLDMWAPWCGPCRMVAPIVDQLATEMAGRVRVAKLNVDENPQTAERFQIRGIPALLVLRAGREIDRIVGAQPKSEIVRRLEQAIAGS
jgi:thioredoxin 2